MGIFKPIEFEYAGKVYQVQANNVLRLIAQVEEVITLQELTGNTDKISLSRLALAYARALNYAGCDVSADQIYQSMFKESGTEKAVNAITQLLILMLPPGDYQPPREPGKKKRRKRKKRPRASN